MKNNDQISNFIQKDFQTTQPYVGINSIREKLIRHSAIVVLEDDTNDFLGVLTLPDIVQRQHNLVIDCVTKKPILKFECKVAEALEIMRKQNAEVLPVANEISFFEGLVFKDDLIAFLFSQNAKKRKELHHTNQEIENQNLKLKEIAWEQSHIVRAPLARMIGLINLIEECDTSAMNLNELLALIKRAGFELDTVIRNIVKKSEIINSDLKA